MSGISIGEKATVSVSCLSGEITDRKRKCIDLGNSGIDVATTAGKIYVTKINKERDKQIIKGIKVVDRFDRDTEILIYCEGWPSLAFEISNSVNNVYLCSKDDNNEFLDLLPGNVTNLSIGESFERLQLFDGWIFYQGGHEFLSECLYPKLQDFPGALEKSLLILPKTRTSNKAHLNKIWKWYCIRHSSIGGVTNSYWSVGIPGHYSLGPFSELLPTYGLSRSFVDVIKPTETGKFIANPVGLEVQRLVSLKEVDKKYFELPSCLVSSGWVRRKLCIKELGAVYDIPELLLGKITADGSLPFLSGCPGKLAQLMAAVWRAIDHSSMNVTACTEDSGKKVVYSESNKLMLNVDAREQTNPEDDYLAAYGEKAAKDDDAEVPVHLWDVFLFKNFLIDRTYSASVHGSALRVIREKFAFRIYLRNITKSFLNYLTRTYGERWLTLYYDHKLKRLKSLRKRRRSWGGNDLHNRQNLAVELTRDLEVGIDGLRRVVKASWWSWSAGSTLFFWRWPLPIRKAVRDGYPCYVQGKLPKYRVKQRPPPDKNMHARMEEKLNKVVERGYINDGYVTSLINCFAVPKGDADIRLVYDGTKSKLNQALWAPNFFLPSIDSVLMWSSASTWYADLDLGEMFLNYFLDMKIRPYTGVDLTAIFSANHTLWKRWERCYMGGRPSPFCCCKLFGWTIDVIHGDRRDPTNPYRWNRVLRNLPGASDYDPSQPRVCKLCEDSIAAELESFVDDVRTQDVTEVGCRIATRRAAQLIQYLGQQDAPRKYRPPHQTPGPWCGTFVASKNDAVWVYVSQEKWNKANQFINELWELCEADEEEILLDYKFVEKGRGFMVYFCRTYTSFSPHLKGLHLTLDSWRSGRNPDGWKDKAYINQVQDDIPEMDEDLLEDDDFVTCKDDDGTKTCMLNPSKFTREGHPAKVSPVPRLKFDLSALKAFLDSDTPPWRFVRGKQVATVQYGFGDASKAGFGTSFQVNESEVWYRLGVWGSDMDSESSNFRELSNLVESLEAKVEETNFTGFELFLFTDNSTAEAAFYRGTSSNEKLFNLVLRLKVMEMRVGCKIHFIHVAGTRMIAQGSDGLSRGDLGEGVMKGDSIMNYIPLHLSALERRPCLREWIESWAIPDEGQSKIEFLSMEDWFERGHDIIGGKVNEDGVWIPEYRSGTFIWSPPPAAAWAAVEQLRRARLKRENSTHIFILPRLMTAEFKRQLFRVSDLYIELPFNEAWPKSSEHEPLIFAVVFPFLRFCPWQLKRSAAFLGMGRTMRQMWNEGEIPSGVVLRKLFTSQRKVGSVSAGVVREMLSSPEQFGLLHSPGRE